MPESLPGAPAVHGTGTTDPAAGSAVFVPGPEGWVPAPPDYLPPLGWLPTPKGWAPAPPGWSPPRGWIHTPSGWLPPGLDTGGDRSPSRAVRVFGWPTVRPGFVQQKARATDRHPSGWEIILVLLLFPALAFVTAVGSLLQLAFHEPSDASYVHDLLPGHPWPSAVVATAATLVEFSPPLLAVYLLRLSGGGRAVMGLDRSAPRADLARCLKLMLLTYVPGFLLVAVISALTGQHNEVAHAIPPNAAYLLPLLVSAVGAGVVEEIVVLGYLIHRLEQRGWSPTRILIAATVVRASYHLYYGWGTIGIALWGALSVLLYRRRPRLLTFVVLHVLWDGWQFIDIYAHGAFAAIAPLTTLAALFGFWLFGRRSALREIVAS